MSNDWPPKRLRFSKEELRQERTWVPAPKRATESPVPSVKPFQRKADDLPLDSDWMD